MQITIFVGHHIYFLFFLRDHYSVNSLINANAVLLYFIQFFKFMFSSEDHLHDVQEHLTGKLKSATKIIENNLPFIDSSK